MNVHLNMYMHIYILYIHIGTNAYIDIYTNNRPQHCQSRYAAHANNRDNQASSHQAMCTPPPRPRDAPDDFHEVLVDREQGVETTVAATITTNMLGSRLPNKSHRIIPRTILVDV